MSRGLPCTLHSLQFSSETVLFGNLGEHPLLAPVLMGRSSYRPVKATRGCWIDLARPDAASKTLRRIVGVGLAQSEPPKAKKKNGRPGSGKSQAERARAYRARQKAARMEADNGQE